MKDFEHVKDIITNYSKSKIKTLDNCTKTIEALKKENESSNEYISLARNFMTYESGKDDDDGTDDWCFYKFLKETVKNNKYKYRLNDKEYVEAEVDVFKPFYDEKEGLINPQWHLLVSYYAYIDAAFNHPNNEYANRILERNDWTKRKPIKRSFSNKALTIWMEEAKL